jgi:hypothetical protein
MFPTLFNQADDVWVLQPPEHCNLEWDRLATLIFYKCTFCNLFAADELDGDLGLMREYLRVVIQLPSSDNEPKRAVT